MPVTTIIDTLEDRPDSRRAYHGLWKKFRDCVKQASDVFAMLAGCADANAAGAADHAARALPELTDETTMDVLLTVCIFLCRGGRNARWPVGLTHLPLLWCSGRRKDCTT